MDGRDGSMGMSTPTSYYLHREIDGGALSSAFPSLPNPGSNVPVLSSSAIGSGAFQMETPPAVSSHDGNLGGVFCEGMSQSDPVKRKRGRPRKYGLDGNEALALSPISSVSPISGSSIPVQKRGRGRPPGTGKKQQLASLGDCVSGSAGMGFTPHTITIAVGEDIASKIMTFLHQGPRAACILSANGAVSTVTLCQPATSGGIVTYEGRFEILCLSGSYMVADSDGVHSRSGGLTISLSSPDGRVIGGCVVGLLIAATPVQVVVGSFVHAGSKSKNKNKNKNKADHESGIEPELRGDTLNTLSDGLPDQNFPSPQTGSWPDSRQLDIRNSHIDIDLMLG